MVTSEGENLVFIFSLPRSGSTVLSIIMGAHSRVYCPPEPWFLLRLAEVYGEPTSERIFDDYYASLATRAFLSEESFLKSARAFALQAYNDCLEKEKRAIFVDKTPRYYHILDFIDQLFPKAKKLWLKRNPLDVAASYKRSWHIGIDVLTGEKVDPAAFDLTTGLHRYVEYFDKESPYKFEVKYENIVSSPKKTVEDLCMFCGIHFEDEMLQIGSNKELFKILEESVVGDRSVLKKKSLDNSSIGRWKNELTEKEVMSLLDVIGDRVFKRMGYEEVISGHAGPALKGSSVEIENDMAFRKDLFRKARFGVIYRDWQEYRQKTISLEKYVAKLKTDFQEQGNLLRGYLKSLLASRYLNLGWKLGLARKPAWVEVFLEEQRFLSKEQYIGSSEINQMIQALQHLVQKKFAPQVVLDIGAAKGYWSLEAGNLFREAEFYMIDALEESEEILRSICESDSRFHYILTVVGSETGCKTMNITPDCDGSSLLEYYGGGDASRQRHIQITTIDQLLSEGRIKPPDLVKIGVQGFEMKVLQGGERMFETAEVFIIETNLYRFMPDCPLVHEIISHMAEKDFFLFDLAGSLRRPFENNLAQLDLVFVSASSPLVSSNRWM